MFSAKMADMGVMVTPVIWPMFTFAEAESAGFSTEVAVTVAVAGFGTVEGAVYMPVEVIAPGVALHVTDEPSLTVAVNCWVWPTRRFALAGETATVTLGGGG
jgi:hypothetical protein